MPVKAKKKMTAAWLSNAAKAFATVGLDFKTLKPLDCEYLARLWAQQVDAGEDFGSAASRVLDNLETAGARADRLNRMIVR